MTIEKPNEFGPLNEATLQAFLVKHGLTLPADYRHFLLTYNGGEPSPDRVPFAEHGTSTASDLRYLCGIHNGEDWASLEWHMQTYDGRLPLGFPPIGYDSGGNVYALGLESPHRNHVYFWQHEYEADPEQGEEPSMENMSFIVASFTALMDSLFEYIPSNESVVQRIIRTSDLNELTRMVASGYDIESEDTYGRTLIENAAIHNRLAIFHYLLGAGASLRSSLEYARQNQHSGLVKLIEEASEGDSTDTLHPQE